MSGQADRGTFFLDGVDIKACSENEMSDIRLNKIGFVFQSFHLLPKQSALANVEMPLNYARVPKKERRERALKALDRVGLADRVDFKPNQLSGGQMQRLPLPGRSSITRNFFLQMNLQVLLTVNPVRRLWNFSRG